IDPCLFLRSRNNTNLEYICSGVLMWKQEWLDVILVPAGLVVMVAYHVWLGYAIIHRPKLTVISLNAESRRQWVFSMMTFPDVRGPRNLELVLGSCEYVSRNLNRASYFWSLGLRAFYFSFPLFLWNFGPIPMFVCCCMMSSILYFLDTTTSFTRHLHSESFREIAESMDGEIESAVHSL
ncbi:hypothetical protein F2Q68_00032373, partial [Brassica cretica]